MTIVVTPRNPPPFQAALPMGLERPVFFFDDPEWDDRRIEALVDEMIRKGAYIPPSRYKLLKDYNGATGQERRDGGNKWALAVRAGLIPRSHLKVCSICLSTQNLQAHNENYFRPCNARPVCVGCHQAIHQRSYRPNNWLAKVHANKYPGAWFANVPLQELTRAQAQLLASRDDPFDLAPLDPEFVHARRRTRR